jgi:antirestriction protein
MTVTLTASYKEFLKADTVECIDTLLEENYELTDILEFIDENSEGEFVAYYADYVEQGERCGFDVVDAFAAEFGMEEVANCEDSFVGSYESKEDFAEEFYSEQYNLPCELVVDWEETFDRSLYYDFTFVSTGYREGYVFRSNF